MWWDYELVICLIIANRWQELIIIDILLVFRLIIANIRWQ